MNHELSVDLRGMIPLNWRKHLQYTRYLASEAADGTITLVPAVLVPAKLAPPEMLLRESKDIEVPGEQW